MALYSAIDASPSSVWQLLEIALPALPHPTLQDDDTDSIRLVWESDSLDLDLVYCKTTSIVLCSATEYPAKPVCALYNLESDANSIISFVAARLPLLPKNNKTP
jgi:hypothetical protein